MRCAITRQLIAPGISVYICNSFVLIVIVIRACYDLWILINLIRFLLFQETL